jgi:peptidoglycan/LPS O-acetylase OafA/YrhL
MSFFRLEQSHNRVFGLDLLRFIAIFMVLIGHSLILVPADLKPGFHKILLDGVAIFFVLSGFLIGGILIKQLEREAPTLKGLRTFWSRRWMRTVPAYVFILLILLIYTAIAIPGNLPADWWRFFLFIHNFEHVPPSFFAESWSLSIEEWFYLTIPVILFGSLALLKTRLKPTIMVVSLLVIAVITWYRYHIYHKFDFHSANPENLPAFKDYIDHRITYSVIPRLDAIMFGVIGAFVAFYFPKIWKSKWNIALIIIGCWLLYYTKRNMGPKYGEYSAVWFPLIKSLVVLMMLPFLAGWKNGFGKVTRFVTFFSLISYSMYLINLNVVTNMLIKNIIHGNYEGIAAENVSDKEMRLNNMFRVTGNGETETYVGVNNTTPLPVEMTQEELKAYEDEFLGKRRTAFQMKKYYPGKHIVGEDWYWDYAMFWAFVVGISFLMYKYIETPFMNLRDRRKTINPVPGVSDPEEKGAKADASE